MQTNPHKETPQQQVQRVALAIHGITDRFSAHEEAFGKRLKESALELIEETALYEIARTRDAAGTARLIHKLIERTEALRQLLSFVQNRGLVRTGVIEHLNFELTELINTFRAEDARFEEHVTRKHPHGRVVESHPEPERAEGEGGPEDVAGISEDPRIDPRVSASTPSSPDDGYDPLLGPDEVTASAANAVGSNFQEPISKKETATAVLEKTETPTAAAPANLPAAETDSDIRVDPRTNPRVSASTSSESANAGDELTDRQKKILALFTRENEAPLKRVKEVLPMFSEKTLRNDLNALRKAGKIKRVGRAPRSKYVLVG